MRGRNSYWGGVTTLPLAQKLMLALLLVAIGLANIDQPYPDLALLQHMPTVILAAAAPMVLRRWPLSSSSVASIWIFLLFHTLGGRYIYSYVPYDAWAEALTGQALSAMFGWSRNHYDRFVHLAFGLLFTLPIREALVRRHGLDRRMGLFVAFAVIAMVGALYEVFEWALTLVAAGDMADYYNGQQGDMWDAQKDMVLNQLGSAIAILWTGLKKSG